jgi:hypothetical protein
MTAERRIGWARGVGFVLGIGLAVTAILGWRLPRGTGRLGADIAIAFLQTGELQLSSVTPLINESDLRPGASVDGSVDLRNSSGSRLLVRVTADPSITDLDRLLWIDISVDRTRIYHGPLGALREGSGRFTISPQQSRILDVRAWLPPNVDEGYQGRIDQVSLTFDPTVVAP